MVEFIGTTPEGWGFYFVFSLFANKSCCTKRTKKQTQSPSRIRLRRDGWDTVQSLKLLTEEDMAELHIFPGHCPLLVDTLNACNGAWLGIL